MEKNNQRFSLTHDCLAETLLLTVPMSILSSVSLAKICYDEVSSDEESGLHRFTIKLPAADMAKIYGMLQVLFAKGRFAGQLIAFSDGTWFVAAALKDFFNKLDRRGQHTLSYAAIAMSQAMKPADILSSFKLRMGGNFFACLGGAELRMTDTFGALAEGKEHKPDWHPLLMKGAETPELKLGLIIGLASACSSFYEEEDNRERSIVCR